MQLWSLRVRLPIGGCVLIVLGLIIYFVKGFTPVLALPVIGIFLIIAGVLYKPRKKPEPPIEETD